MYLEKIKNTSDLKAIKKEELPMLSEEIRNALFNRLTKKGGHFGSNFGMVEAEIAMHYVFNSPKDKFVFDVSHQSYPHKILTGRAEFYLDEGKFNEISGYTNPDESEHDFFKVGHTSTSVSLAAGLAKGRDLNDGKENIIAIIGDGSLSGGEALEGLNFVGSELHSNLIIVVNDNQQSIAENHGGLYKNLEELRNTNGESKNNLFKALGLDYVYEAEGNDINKMIEVFERVKDINHPVVVHINTKKGQGYKYALENKEAWHWTVPFNKETGLPTFDIINTETYEEITSTFLMNKIKKDKSVVVVTPAMPGSIGFDEEKRKEAEKQYIDVGIAEEHAVALISGIAKNGGKPVLGTNATFIQRAYDQISQDLCMNKNPATIILNYTSVAGLTDVTHLGIFIISAFSSIPNLVILAPTNKQEYISMLDWSIEQNEHPVMILIPGNGVIEDKRNVDREYKDINKFKIEKVGSQVAILGLGDFYQLGEKLSFAIEKELGFTPTLINPRFASGLDTEILDSLKLHHKLVITLEDGILDGGFGANVASYYGTSNMKVQNYGIKKSFPDRYNVEEFLKENGLSVNQITADVKTILSE